VVSMEERRRRIRRMRRKLRQSTIFDWMDSIMARCTEIIAADQDQRTRQVVG